MIPFRTTYSDAERAVIAELVSFAELMAESAQNAEAKGVVEWPARAFGAMLLERAAMIVRGDSPRTFTDQDVLNFASFWQAHEPAEFNK